MRARVLVSIAVAFVIAGVAFLSWNGGENRPHESDSASPGVVAEPVAATPTARLPANPASPPASLQPSSPAMAGWNLTTPAPGSAPVVIAPAVPLIAPTKPGSRPDVPPPVVSSPPPPGKNGAPDISSEEVAIDVDKVNLSLRDYRTIMGENPVGTNAEIVRALNGGNPKQARLLHEGLNLNRDGELVDRWGTPYFFHQLSKDHMQIRSAGPDRKMWTDDDTFSN